MAKFTDVHDLLTAYQKQALREEFQYMQNHYSDPADRERQVIYIAAEALLDELEAKEEQRANWFQMAQKLGEDLDAAEKRIAELEAKAFNPAILDVIAERQRQQSVEGWTPEHDDLHDSGELAAAAACYALYAHRKPIAPAFPYNWPWEPKWFKQQGARRDLVKAGALILAEIERIDRAAGIGKGE